MLVPSERASSPAVEDLWPLFAAQVADLLAPLPAEVVEGGGGDLEEVRTCWMLLPLGSYLKTAWSGNMKHTVWLARHVRQNTKVS